MSNYGILKNGLPAERQCGLTFYEKFENASEVVKNGGATSGTPTIADGIAYFSGGVDGFIYDYFLKDNKSFTVEGWFKYDSSFDFSDFSTVVSSGTYEASPNMEGFYFYWHSINQTMRVYFGDGGKNNVIINGIDDINVLKEWTHFAVVYDHDNSRAYLYMNGALQASEPMTGFTASDVYSLTIGTRRSSSPQLSMEGCIKGIRLFNGVALTAEEILDYYNESVFDYEKDAVLNLPMGLAQHDSDNNRTLDVSGYNNHGIINGDITKIPHKKGYNLPGSSFISCPVLDQVSITEDTEVTLAACFKSTLNDYFQMIMSTSQDGNNRLYIGKYSSNVAIFGTGNQVGGSHAPLFLSTHTAALVIKDNRVSYFVDGVLMDTRDFVNFTTAMNLHLGSHGSSLYFYGDIYEAKYWDKALTPMQVKDLHIRMMQSLNTPVPVIKSTDKT